MFLSSCKLCVLGAVLSSTTLAASSCPLLGADFPAPKNLSSSQTFQASLSNLTQVIAESIASGKTIYGALDAVNTSWSMEMFSIHEDSPLFSHQFTAPAIAKAPYGTKNVTADTTFRIGSCTKLFSVYTFLIQAGDGKWNDPVTKYIPELAAAAVAFNATQNPLDQVSWEEVTLGELASHQAGLGRDFAALGEINGPLSPVKDTAALGLPPLNASEGAVCAGGAYCTRAKFFQGFTARHPVYAPSTNPVYSNVAFQVLAYAMENITGLDMPTMVAESLLKPLNLTHSSWLLPKLNTTGILPVSNTWTLDLGDETAAGGMYSSSSDLTIIGRSILKSSLISPAQTRRWMKPHGLVSANNAAVGAPWEIYRLESNPDKRIVDLYTKNGDLGSYSGVFVLSPDWEVGFSVLTAGPAASFNSRILAALVSDVVFGAVQDAAREEAEASFSGTFESAVPGLNSSVTIVTDDEPGLGVNSWISNGTDMLNSAVSKAGIVGTSVRLYPSGLSRDIENGEKEIGFRAVFYGPASPQIGGLFGTQCDSWVAVDSKYWGTVGTDEFLVRVGSDGIAKSVTPRALRAELVRSC